MSKMKKILACFMLVITAFVITPTTAHTKTIVKSNPHYDYFYYNGEFSRENYFDLARNISNYDYVDTIVFNSSGGEFYAGLKVSEIIREKNLKIIVPYGKFCVSACAFASMASDDITIKGLFGLHRPYNSIGMSGTETLDSYSNTTAVAASMVTLFFVRNGYSVDLLFGLFYRTDRKKFIVFDSQEDLAKYKTNDIFSNIGEEPFENFKIMKASEMLKLHVSQKKYFNQ